MDPIPEMVDKVGELLFHSELEEGELDADELALLKMLEGISRLMMEEVEESRLWWDGLWLLFWKGLMLDLGAIIFAISKGVLVHAFSTEELQLRSNSSVSAPCR